VRWIKQLIDLSGQVADAAGGGNLRATARDVVRQVRRGVVAVAPLED
jgi:ATP-dependent RNA helicase HelY